MGHDRPGEWLWEEWDGEGYDGDIVYVTYEPVDMTNEIVRRALASSLQRDGVADSLGDGFKMVELSTFEYINIGTLYGETRPVVCDPMGETEFGDIVESMITATFVTIS